MKKFHNFLAKRIKQAQKLPLLRTDNGNLIKTDLEKANALAELFASNYSLKLNERSHNLPLPTTDSSVTHVPQRSFDFVIYPNEVLTVLKRLNPSFSCPYHGIPQIFYQKCADVLYLPLAHIFKALLIFSEVPNIWKEALITAIPKKSNSNALSNFRPISIVSSASKVLEKIIKEKLNEWLSSRDVIPFEQHGFQSGSFTTSPLSDSVYDWMTEVNKGKSVDAILFDLSKAFGMVNHKKLLFKLENYGVRGQLLSWLKSYLQERHMTVKVHI
ncbi:hypothetical protein RB195_017323 [Necator americanus]|uniref:Reverse transcriptase domain-containing protein n=1 Tax=Necator americanus TaxID=51031 RepID=A0ABR1C6N7_NECAM